MKITEVKAYYLEIPFDKPLRVATSPEVAIKSEAFVLVKVFTDEGIVGIGAQRTPFPAWTKYIESSVRAFLLNEIVDPSYTEKFARYYRSLALGTGVSPRPCCVEMALWDIVGKAAGQPVFQATWSVSGQGEGLCICSRTIPPLGAKGMAGVYKKPIR